MLYPEIIGSFTFNKMYSQSVHESRKPAVEFISTYKSLSNPHYIVLLINMNILFVRSDTKAVIGKQRQLLLALQWINFPADTDDLLLLFSLDIYWKLVVLCGLVSTKIEDDVVLPDSQLTLRTNLSALFQLENVALRTG